LRVCTPFPLDDQAAACILSRMYSSVDKNYRIARRRSRDSDPGICVDWDAGGAVRPVEWEGRGSLAAWTSEPRFAGQRSVRVPELGKLERLDWALHTYACLATLKVPQSLVDTRHNVGP
jgi:hypothetical protein